MSDSRTGPSRLRIFSVPKFWLKYAVFVQSGTSLPIFPTSWSNFQNGCSPFLGDWTGSRCCQAFIKLSSQRSATIPIHPPAPALHTCPIHRVPRLPPYPGRGPRECLPSLGMTVLQTPRTLDPWVPRSPLRMYCKICPRTASMSMPMHPLRLINHLNIRFNVGGSLPCWLI
jgi:hypothetical protein